MVLFQLKLNSEIILVQPLTASDNLLKTKALKFIIRTVYFDPGLEVIKLFHAQLS